MTIPDFLAMAIEHERKLVELRKKQIEGYKQRISLMEGGLDYEKALERIPPVSSGIKFHKNDYLLKKKNYMEKNNVESK